MVALAGDSLGKRAVNARTDRCARCTYKDMMVVPVDKDGGWRRLMMRMLLLPVKIHVLASRERLNQITLSVVLLLKVLAGCSASRVITLGLTFCWLDQSISAHE